MYSANKLAERIVKNKMRDFLSEVKTIRNAAGCRSSMVDGVSEPQEMELFAGKCAALYISVFYDV